MGRKIGLMILGADSGGVVSSLFQAGSGIVDYVQQQRAEEAATTDAGQKLAAAIAADQAATAAAWRAAASADLAKKSPTQADAAKADAMAADAAQRTADAAGAAVPEGKRSARTAAAQKGVDAAQTKLENALRSGSAIDKKLAQFELSAWQATLARTQGIVPSASGAHDAGAGGGKGASDDASPGVLSRTIAGPVKVWHALASVVAAGLAAAAWKLTHRKKS